MGVEVVLGAGDVCGFVMINSQLCKENLFSRYLFARIVVSFLPYFVWIFSLNCDSPIFLLERYDPSKVSFDSTPTHHLLHVSSSKLQAYELGRFVSPPSLCGLGQHTR